ncbi:benzoate/H(+) symporter BenE family transporter [Martelella lutilitoris]|uniref:Benzoate/H(+) symporter BenE family transporter n=1 Tax=Martelella lutilitoris TaxID=2583532 RepID=A0A5C4JVR7_9HYPH|nr:benzoate/H(+) symporter BenE family transporter [Martelella lutilitoris]TNB49307.1 benzoate/H(+) symporter BenE family transporter [Martelella lutilitoris]
MLKDFSAQSLFMGLLVAFVGFASSFSVVLQGLEGIGASPAQSASGLMALSIVMGIAGIVISAVTRMPVSIAWSTPGAALLATAGTLPGGFAEAVGAFIVANLLIIAAGLLKPVGRAISAIPAPLANAMLAGVLLALCFAPVEAVKFDPLLGLPIIIAFVVAGAFNRLLAVPAALGALVLVLVLGVDLPAGSWGNVWREAAPLPVWVTPAFSLQATISVALPLFIVTMASQNIPGVAILAINEYRPSAGRMFSLTGLFSLVAAPFGGHGVNLAAITAAMCAGPDAHADPKRRYWAAIVAGIGYVVFGLMSGLVVALVSLAPPILIEAVAGLALIGAFAAAALAAFKEPDAREAAAITFLVAASGVGFFGISGAFWGLAAGLAITGIKGLAKRRHAGG